MTAKVLLNQLRMLDDKYGLDSVPLDVFHNSQRCAYQFVGLSMDIDDNKQIKEIKINITKNNKYAREWSTEK